MSEFCGGSLISTATYSLIFYILEEFVFVSYSLISVL